MGFVNKNTWTSLYNAKNEATTVQYILADRFDDIFLADLKSSFEKCLRTDSGNSLTQPFNAFNYRVINVATPTASTDAANAKYVQDQIYRFEAIINNNAATGTISLATNKQYSMNQTGAITFKLPTPSNTNVVNQILIDLKCNGSAINLGTTKKFERSITAFTKGAVYSIIFEYSNQLSAWVVGIMLKA